MKLRDIPTGVRVELLEPLSQRPSRRYLLQLATTNLQSFFNEIQATGRPWAVCDEPIILTVNPGQSEYVLPAGPEFGRVMDVTTYDPSDPSLNERQVPFFELADQKFDQHSLHAVGYPDLRVSFFKKGFQSDTYVSVFPLPQDSFSLRILYSLGEWATSMSLDDSFLLTQHHALLVIKTALDALPGSAWFTSEPENRLRRGELQTSLAGRLPIHMEQFRRHIRNVTQPRMTDRLVYSID